MFQATRMLWSCMLFKEFESSTQWFQDAEQVQKSLGTCETHHNCPFAAFPNVSQTSNSGSWLHHFTIAGNRICVAPRMVCNMSTSVVFTVVFALSILYTPGVGACSCLQCYLTRPQKRPAVEIDDSDEALVVSWDYQATLSWRKLRRMIWYVSKKDKHKSWDKAPVQAFLQVWFL